MAEMADRLARIRSDYLSRDEVPRFLWSEAQQTQTRGDVELTLLPLRPEAQAWNDWPDGTARLFNDSAGYLWGVRVRCSRPWHWVPSATELAVNDTEQVFAPAASPDDLLRHLLAGSYAEMRVGLNPDLGLRLRNADPLRRAYLGTDTRAGDREGLVLFPAPAHQLQALTAQVTLGVFVEGAGLETFTFVFQ